MVSFIIFHGFLIAAVAAWYPIGKWLHDRHKMLRQSAIWNPSLEFVCCSCHLAWGAFLWLFVASVWGWPTATADLVAVFAVKEVLVDTQVETTTMPLEVLDFAFYMFGGALGCVAWVLIPALR